MSRNLTAQDRSALIRLASSLPSGSPERKAILSGLAKAKRASSKALEPYLATSTFKSGDYTFSVSYIAGGDESGDPYYATGKFTKRGWPRGRKGQMGFTVFLSKDGKKVARTEVWESYGGNLDNGEAERVLAGLASQKIGPWASKIVLEFEAQKAPPEYKSKYEVIQGSRYRSHPYASDFGFPEPSMGHMYCPPPEKTIEGAEKAAQAAKEDWWNQHYMTGDAEIYAIIAWSNGGFSALIHRMVTAG